MRIAVLCMVAALVAPDVPARGQEPELFYEEDGSGPAVVLVPGWGHDTSSWFPLLPRMRPGWRLVRYDLRGQGRSAPPADGEYSIRAHVADLERVLAARGIEAAHLVGAGWGGTVVAEFALRSPDRVRSIVLVDPRLHWSREELEWWNRFLAAYERAGRPSLGEYTSLLLERWYGTTMPTLQPWLVPFYDLMLRRQDADELVGGLQGALVYDFVAPSEPVGVPALLIRGDRRLDGRGEAELRVAFGHVERTTVDAGEIPQIEIPRELGRTVVEFLGRMSDR